MHLALSLPRFAALRAEIDAGTDRREVLAREGLSTEQWLETQRGWLSLMASEADRGHLGPCRHYHAVYAETAPELLGIAPAPTESEHAIVEEASIDETSAALGIDLRDVLPFDEDAVPAEPIDPVPDDDPPHPRMGATAFIQAVDLDVSTPFGNKLVIDTASQRAPLAGTPPAPMPLAAAAPQPPAPPPSPAPAPPAPAPPAPAPPAPAPRPAPPAATAPPAPASERQAVPFAGEGAAPARVGDDVAEEARDMVGETGFVGALSDADLAAALPFGAKGVSAPDPAVPPGPENIDVTAPEGVVAIGEALPFASSREAPAPAAGEIEAQGDDLVGGTAFVSALSDEELAGGLPFEQTARAAPSLSVEQYASLCVELARSDRHEVLARYRLAGEPALAALQQHWQPRLAAEPELAARYRNAYAQYEAWLLKR